MNELLFLGTGAADWDIGHREGFFRRNAAALLNGNLLLDCGPHVWDYVHCKNGHALDKVTDVLITHDHSDHFDECALVKLADRQKIRVACDGFVRWTVGEHPNIEYVPVVPYTAFSLGKYKVMPVLANHDVVQHGIRQACHYIIRTPNHQTVFYGLDGAWFLRPSWKEMCRHKYDVMVLDCTVGDREDWRLFEHNTIPMLRQMVREIHEKKLLNRDGVLVASHLARTLHDSHEQTEAVLKELSMMTAFDGMKIHF